MDAGDLVYVVIILIGLISGFLKKNKKNNQNPQKTSDIDQVLEQLLGKTKQEIPIPKVKYENQSQFTTTVEKDQSLESTQKTTDQIIKEHKSVLDVQDEYDDVSNSKRQNIDLKQAVIYDAILNRPDY